MLSSPIKIAVTTLLLAGAALSGSAGAEGEVGDAAAGAQKIALCAACHGMDGKATADVHPNLAGQSVTYLETSLKAYLAGERSGCMPAVMKPQANNLHDLEIADI